MNVLTQKLAHLGLFTALAAILGYLESLFPIFPSVPGIKLGLANLSVLFLLLRYTWKEAAVVSAARIFIIGFLFGNFFGIVYSCFGAAVSLTAMAILSQKTDASPVMISIFGGIFHNIGQLIAAIWLAQSLALLYYAPALLISGILTGTLVGVLTMEVKKRVR